MTDLREQLQSTLGQSYTVERELGGGGMSRVFVAEELSLGRRVVVKVIAEELSGSVSVARFRREISLAARLQHPHIVPVLSAGEIDGLPYYTMPFVEGDSLRARLSHGELPIPEVISILRDVARALEYAHGRGVTHRDIKPDNVLLAGTSAVVTDLGVAKAISDATAVGSLTSVGIALGTPAYMAPEQAAADPATDHRADIYALGMMAYEMLAGHVPFAGRSAQAILAAHIAETPTTIATLRPATPPRLAALVMRCVAKRPGDRPQTASEVVRELEMAATPLDGSLPPAVAAPASRGQRVRWTLVAGIVVAAITTIGLATRWRSPSQNADSVIRSMAILPFENTSGDTTLNYLEDGITDYLRDALNAMPGVTVKARSSSRREKGHDAREVGPKLGVGVVLLGSLSGSGSRLHVTAELVRTADDNALWSGTFDGRPNELLGIQDTIVRSIAATLHLARKPGGTPTVASHGARGTSDPEAYDLLLRGRYEFDRTEFVRAELYFRQALARDPRFARARALLAVAQAGLPLQGIGPLDSINAVAQRNAEQALAMDSTVVEAYIAESNVLGNDLRATDQLAPLERAMKIDSTDVDLLTGYGLALGQAGRIPEALATIQRAHARDSLALTPLAVSGYYLCLLRRCDAGIPMMKAAIDLDPNVVLIRLTLGNAYAFAGRPDSAVQQFESAFRIDSTAFASRSYLIFGYAAAGRWSDAERHRALLDRQRGSGSVNFEQMVAHVAFGEYDSAMTSLERSVAAREPMLWPFSIACDPLFDPLKSNPRFAAVMKRLGARACSPTAKWPIAKRT
jgi:eukaryotic-like serine/threonine-protein kinase